MLHNRKHTLRTNDEGSRAATRRNVGRREIAATRTTSTRQKTEDLGKGHKTMGKTEDLEGHKTIDSLGKAYRKDRHGNDDRPGRGRRIANTPEEPAVPKGHDLGKGHKTIDSLGKGYKTRTSREQDNKTTDSPERGNKSDRHGKDERTGQDRGIANTPGGLGVRDEQALGQGHPTIDSLEQDYKTKDSLGKGYKIDRHGKDERTGQDREIASTRGARARPEV